MIHVQIASQVTAQGVHGVRWVLIEALDAPLPTEPDPVAVHAAAPADGTPAQVGSAAAGSLQLGALKLAVVGLGLGAALWTAHVQVGPPGARPSPLAAPQAPAATPATQGGHGGPALSAPPAQVRPLPPATVPGPAAPTSPAASGSLPRLTAAL
jgi:hypothetical protein